MSKEASELPPDGENAPHEEPYEWDKCTIHISIMILPRDGKEGGRPVIVGCATHRDPPILESTRREGFKGLVPDVTGLLERLRLRLPEQARIAESRRLAEQEAAREAAERFQLRRLQRKDRQQQTKGKIEAPRSGTPAKESPPSPAAGPVTTGEDEAKQSTLF